MKPVIYVLLLFVFLPTLSMQALAQKQPSEKELECSFQERMRAVRNFAGRSESPELIYNYNDLGGAYHTCPRISDFERQNRELGYIISDLEAQSAQERWNYGRLQIFINNRDYSRRTLEDIRKRLIRLDSLFLAKMELIVSELERAGEEFPLSLSYEFPYRIELMNQDGESVVLNPESGSFFELTDIVPPLQMTVDATRLYRPEHLRYFILGKDALTNRLREGIVIPEHLSAQMNVDLPRVPGFNHSLPDRMEVLARRIALVWPAFGELADEFNLWDFLTTYQFWKDFQKVRRERLEEEEQAVNDFQKRIGGHRSQEIQCALNTYRDLRDELNTCRGRLLEIYNSELRFPSPINGYRLFDLQRARTEIEDVEAQFSRIVTKIE